MALNTEKSMALGKKKTADFLIHRITKGHNLIALAGVAQWIEFHSILQTKVSPA